MRTARIYPLVWIAGLAFAALFFFIPPIESGDYIEYSAVMRAWAQHGSPEIRRSDLMSAPSLFDTYPGFYRVASPDYVYGFHFWLYALACVPAYLALQALHLNPLAAFQVTNASLFVAAVYLTLHGSSALLPRRLIFLLLSIAGPLVLYWQWQGPEVWSWSFIMMALALLERHRRAEAVLCASLAAMQNPPLLAFVVWTAWSAWNMAPSQDGNLADNRHLPWNTRVLIVLSAAMSLLPFLYFLVFLGIPNPLTASGLASPRFISLARTVSLFSDLNDGLLPHVGLLSLATLVSVALCLGQRASSQERRRALALLLSLLVGCLLTQTIINWSSSCLGLKRYGIWMLPILAFLALPAFPISLRGVRLAAFFLLAQLLGTLSLFAPYTSNNVLARFVLTHFPALWNPQVENFATRNGAPHADAANWRQFVPIPFVAHDGNVTKLLTRGDDLNKLKARFHIAPTYEYSLRQRAQDEPFYETPRRGALVQRER